MQIVIEATEEEYNDMCDYGVDQCIIKKAIILPEHHGRLIDADYVIDAIDDWMNVGEYRYTNATDYLKKRMRNIRTIVGADKSESEVEV